MTVLTICASAPLWLCCFSVYLPQQLCSYFGSLAWLVWSSFHALVVTLQREVIWGCLNSKLVLSFSRQANNVSIQLHFKSLSVCLLTLISVSVTVLCSWPNSIWVVFAGCRQLHLTLFCQSSISEERDAKKGKSCSASLFLSLSLSLILSHSHYSDVYFMFPLPVYITHKPCSRSMNVSAGCFPSISEEREEWKGSSQKGSGGQWNINNLESEDDCC